MSVYLFAYGSLVSPDSLAGTIGYRPPAARGPLPAVLRDHAREWNVGSDRESHPERALIADDGAPFTGTLAVLGLRVEAGAVCNGALYELEDGDVEALTSRERNYRLVDVTACVAGLARSDPVRPVWTFLPRAAAVERLRAARSRGTAAVRAGYLATVEEAFRRLGPGQSEVYERSTRPHTLPVRAIRIAPRAPIAP